MGDVYGGGEGRGCVRMEVGGGCLWEWRVRHERERNRVREGNGDLGGEWGREDSPQWGFVRRVEGGLYAGGEV